MTIEEAKTIPVSVLKMKLADSEYLCGSLISSKEGVKRDIVDITHKIEELMLKLDNTNKELERISRLIEFQDGLSKVYNQAINESEQKDTK